MAQLLNIKFLTSVLPEDYSEQVYEYSSYYSIRCIKQTTGSYSNKEWNALVEKISNEFGDNLIEIDSNTCYGVDFNVYLRKYNETTNPL